MTESQKPEERTDSLAAQLGKILDEAGAQVQFGLRAQGKFETVGRMLREGATEKEIGKAIGWCGATAVRFYALESAMRPEERTPAKHHMRTCASRVGGKCDCGGCPCTL